MESFIKIPRTLFESEAWKDANVGQKVFIVELYSRVAYSRHEQKLKRGTVTVEAGQLAISLREFASELGVPVRTLRRMIDYFSEMGIIDAVAQETSCDEAHTKIKFTLLTIKDISCATKSDHGTVENEKCGTYTEENIISLSLPPIIPQSETILSKILSEQMMWVEAICIHHKFAPDLKEFKETFLSFIGHRICQGNTDFDLVDIKKHFQNWLVNAEGIRERNKIKSQYAANRTNTSRPDRQQRQAEYAEAMRAVLGGQCTTGGYADEVPRTAQPF